MDYFGILYNDDSSLPICNLHFNDENDLKLGLFNDKGKEVKKKINNISDIYNYKNDIITTTKKYLIDKKEKKLKQLLIKMAVNTQENY